jgi:hypothetical protein
VCNCSITEQFYSRVVSSANFVLVHLFWVTDHLDKSQFRKSFEFQKGREHLDHRLAVNCLRVSV